MSEILVDGVKGLVEDIKVYDLYESIKASKYPMAVNVSELDGKITKTTKKLGSCEMGTGHDNFLNGIRVAFDLTFTNKAWVEAERYHFFDFTSSQSTMHRIVKFDLDEQYNSYVDSRIVQTMKELVDKYNKSKDIEDYLKVLYSNPAGFKLTARMATNYRQLKTIYNQRHNHKLPEWRGFCEWVLTLPYFRELTNL